jgi:hypothetical protein
VRTSCVACIVASSIAACHTAASSDDAPAGSEAARLGVQGYRVLRADAQFVDVRLVGPRGGRLTIHALPSHVEQRLVRDDGTTLGLVTDAQTIRVDVGTQSWVVARREGARWAPVEGTVPTATWSTDMTLVLAVDIDMAVQGTSLVASGSEYVACTIECTSAAECIPHWDASECAPHVMTCSACLEQEP